MVQYLGMPITTEDEKEHLERILGLPCCVCLPNEQISRTQAHHIKEGNSRLGHFYTIPLCQSCHDNVHLLRHGVERTLWEQTNQTLGIQRDWVGTKILARPLLGLKC